MIVAELLAKHGIKLAGTAPGRYYTTCPKCSATRSRAHQSSKVLGVTIEADGSVRWGCSHCSWTGPERGSGQRPGQRQDLPTYVYRDDAGVVLFRKVRNVPGKTPRFWLERPDGNGRWIPGTKGIDTKILYRLDEVKRAIADGRTVVCAEGEKDCDNLWKIGIAATCNAHGASESGKQPKWTKAHSEQLAGADIVVLNDNDAAGYAHADTACKLSLGVAKRTRRLDLAKHWPEIPKGGDVSDWLAAGHTGAELEALIAAAPDYEPPPGATQKAPPPDGNGNDDTAELERLARLAPLDYERARKDAGKRLGISRLSTLDLVVKAKRAELGLNGDDKMQGHAIEFPAPEPWPEPVDGAALLNALASAIRRHIVMSKLSSHVAALWTLQSWLVNSFVISPRLCIRSATKGCGKTVLLDILGKVLPRPLRTLNVTPALIFRVIESHQPTLLIDDADSFLNNTEGLRNVLNGNRKGDMVGRTVGDDHRPRMFATYSAIVIGLIGALPDTLHDRSVVIDLKRRLDRERIVSFRFDRAGHLEVLARMAARWSQDEAERVAAVDPAMPSGIINREADNWRPLVAIADIAAGRWPARARKAATAAHAAAETEDEGSLLEVLLADIRDIFGDKDEMPSADMVDALVKMEGHPWAEMGRSRKPLTQNRLARLLKTLKIRPDNMRVGDKVAKSYRRQQFEDHFARYLTSKQGGPQPLQRYNTDEMGISSRFQSATASPDVADGKSKKPPKNGHSSAVAVVEGDAKGNGLSRATREQLASLARAHADADRQGGGEVELEAIEDFIRERLRTVVQPDRVEAEVAIITEMLFQ